MIAHKMQIFSEDIKHTNVNYFVPIFPFAAMLAGVKKCAEYQKALKSMETLVRNVLSRKMKPWDRL